MLAKKNLIICFDLDGVICKTIDNDYKKSKPIKNNIKFINSLYENGYIIKIFTARFMGRTNENSFLAEKKAKKMTIKQLKNWGLNYSKLIFGKPSYDIFIDDKNLEFKTNWVKKLKKIIVK